MSPFFEWLLLLRQSVGASHGANERRPTFGDVRDKALRKECAPVEIHPNGRAAFERPHDEGVVATPL
jgi:hypothetical protein